MNFPLTTTQSHILDAKGEEIGRLFDFPDETNAQEIVRLANLGHRVLKEACAAFPPSLIVELTEEEVSGQLSRRSETPPVAGSEPASTKCDCRNDDPCCEEWQAPSRVWYICNRPRGHTGNHQACGFARHKIAELI